MINKKELILAIMLFVALYVIEATLISTLRLRGNAAITTVWATIGAQVLLTMLFYQRKRVTAGFVGTIAVGLQMIMQITGLLMIATT
ncbi:MAG: hypothetical protein HY567_02305 [Candidatus Kerfeldbacteria bacterium]|nr:hypothetical protein [Candidatus Kerfeldbacteria bacterium]